MIVVGEAAAGPAQDGDQSVEIIDGLLAMAIDVGDLRILPYPEAAVDAASEMLREMAVKFRADDAGLFGEIDRDTLVGRRPRYAPARGQNGGARSK